MGWREMNIPRVMGKSLKSFLQRPRGGAGWTNLLLSKHQGTRGGFFYYYYYSEAINLLVTEPLSIHRKFSELQMAIINGH